MYDSLSFFLESVGWQVLPEADYIIDRPNIPLWIERKSIRDFLSSIGDGRLFRQVEALVAATSKVGAQPIVLLEGKWHPAEGKKGLLMVQTESGKTKRVSGYTVTAFCGALLQVQSMGVQILTSGSTEDTVKLVLALAGYKAEVSNAKG